jgi:hypothetical protein
MTHTITVTYSDGQAPREFDSIQAAAAALLAEYPYGTIIDAGGFDHDADDADDAYDVRSGRAALVWETYQASMDDDGANAVAQICVGDAS